MSLEHCREELHLIDERGEVFTGAAAVRETLARLPAAPVTTLLFQVPGGMWLANWIYRCVAWNRGWLARWLD